MITYDKWVEQEAERIHADGCTCVSEWHHQCCLQHDLACHYGKDPLSAYTVFKASDGKESPWLHAKKMSRRQADFMFLHCNDDASGKNPLHHVRSFIRFLGVRLGAVVGIGTREASSD